MSSSTSVRIRPSPNFFANSKSQTVPITTAGSAYLDTFANFLAKWQSGKVSNLQSGLQEVDKQIERTMREAMANTRPAVISHRS
jgi:hypothetical protein